MWFLFAIAWQLSDGPQIKNYKSEMFAFEPDDLYIFHQNMGHCKDMSNILMAGDEVKFFNCQRRGKNEDMISILFEDTLVATNAIVS